MVVPNSSTQEQTLELISEKDKIEQRIAEFGKILEQNHVIMTESLVDEDGFPKNDIDVYQVRYARQQIICLQNDLKALMKQIEKGLEEVHSKNTAQTNKLNSSLKTAGLNLEENSNDQNLIPIAKINLLNPGSPSEDAGLMVGDEIIQFGSITSRNFDNLTSVGEIVKHKQNQRILLKIRRNESILEINLIPRSWNGRGLLGCNIVLPGSVER